MVNQGDFLFLEVFYLGVEGWVTQDAVCYVAEYQLYHTFLVCVQGLCQLFGFHQVLNKKTMYIQIGLFVNPKEKSLFLIFQSCVSQSSIIILIGVGRLSPGDRACNLALISTGMTG